jgi:hypothetical protein
VDKLLDKLVDKTGGQSGGQTGGHAIHFILIRVTAKQGQPGHCWFDQQAGWFDQQVRMP